MKLDDWLEYIKNQHRKEVDLGLQRVKEVALHLGVLRWSCPVIMVGGTNGKGSTVAGITTIYQKAGYRAGAFTSPYLYRFNELVQVNGQFASDEDFIRAFERIEKARGSLTLTQFEFNTLAALLIFQESKLDVMVLEVGLGGRLDAVNIIDADVSVITSIGIDHVDYLGDTREKIAREKAGIFRAYKPAVCGDFDPPVTLQQKNVPLFCQGKAFGFEEEENSWNWWSQKIRLEKLPCPRLALQNMATSLMVIELMQNRLPVKREAIDEALHTVDLAGRLQVIPGKPRQILDVSHNPAAATLLASFLRTHQTSGTTRAVFSMLADKDIVETIRSVRDLIDVWYIAALPVARGASLILLENSFNAVGIQTIHTYADIKQAYHAALKTEKSGSVVVFGSFYTVALSGAAHFNTI